MTTNLDPNAGTVKSTVSTSVNSSTQSDDGQRQTLNNVQQAATPDPRPGITIGRGLDRPQGRFEWIGAICKPSELASAIRGIPSATEAWWSVHTWRKNYRREDYWEAAIGVGVDCDYYPDGHPTKTQADHRSVGADVALRMANEALAGTLPGSIFHATPRGIRLVFCFESPCVDKQLMQRAMRGACALVDKALADLGTFDFETDWKTTCDLARLLYAPKAIVGGNPRNAEVLVMRSGCYSPEELAGGDPGEPPPELPPTPIQPPAGPRNRSRSEKTPETVAEAIDQFNREHTPGDGWGVRLKACPGCGSPDGFKSFRPDPTRWGCYSSRHGSEHGGVKGAGVFHGDALDYAMATDRATDRTVYLRSRGYLAERKGPAAAPVALAEAALTMEAQAEARGGLLGSGVESEPTWVSASMESLVPVPPVTPPSGTRPGRPPQSPGRPVLWVLPEVHAFTDAAISVLAGTGQVYQRTGQMVMIQKSPWIGHAPYKRARRFDVDGAGLLPVLTRYADVFTRDSKGKDVPCVPPAQFVNTILGSSEWSDIPYLTAVFNHPFLRPDGSICDQPGYDTATGIYFNPTCQMPIIPAQPTMVDAHQACLDILDVVCDFPFADGGIHGAHASAWLAAFLTPLCSAAFRGAPPLFVLDGNSSGAGKTKLADVISIVMNGRHFPRRPFSADKEEMRKTIGTIVKNGEHMVLLDNVHGEVGGGALEAALTGREYQDRALGSNTDIEGELGTVWLISANNAELSDDMLRRTSWIRIDVPDETPEDRTGFKHHPIDDYVEQNRVRLLGSALTILRAYAVAGFPVVPGVGMWGSFESWSNYVRNPIVWAGFPDPGATRANMRSKKATVRLALATLVGGLEPVMKSGLTNVRSRISVQVDGLTAGEIIDQIEGDRRQSPLVHSELVAALAELCPSRDDSLPTARRLGMMLAKYEGKWSGDSRIVSAIDSHRRLKVWRLETKAEVLGVLGRDAPSQAAEREPGQEG